MKSTILAILLTVGLIAIEQVYFKINYYSTLNIQDEIVKTLFLIQFFIIFMTTEYLEKNNQGLLK